MRSVAISRAKSQIARPLSVLVPLIQEEVLAGNDAGKEHYYEAGKLLLEVRESGQVAEFKWNKWLKENFALSMTTAYTYMTFAERVDEDPNLLKTSLSMFGIVFPEEYKKRKARRAAFKLHKPIDKFAIERQARADETKLHRALALELIDIGFKALATRLHPDHGGPDNAMRRLNRVRRELNAVAKQRRFDS
jgi:hypothetical protein